MVSKPFPIAGLTLAMAVFLSLAPSVVIAEEKEEEEVKPAEKPLPEVVINLKKKVYNLSEAGLKTLETQVHIPLLADIPMFKSAKVKLYFKAPNQQELDVEGVDPETKQPILLMLKDLLEYTRYLFGLGPVIDYICSCEIDVAEETVEKHGVVKKITARPKQSKGQDKSIDEEEKPVPMRLGIITVWVDKDLKPLRLMQELEGNVSDLDLAVVEKDQKFLISQIILKKKKTDGVESKMKIDITYDKIKELWLPKEISIPSSTGKAAPMKVALKNFKVNENLPQHVFKKKDKEKLPQGNDKEY